MAIGKSGQTGSNATEVLKGATSVRVYPKTNEVFCERRVWEQPHYGV